MFCHVSHVQDACSGARSGMTPSLRAGAPGIPPCSGACLSSAQVLPFNPVPLLPQARGGSHFRACRARPCAGGRVLRARFARLIARARRRTHVSRPLPPGSFAAPAALLRRKAERRPREPPLCSHSTTLFPQSSPRRTALQSPGPGIIPCALTAPGFRLMSGTRRRGGRAVIHRTANPLTPVRIRSAPPGPSPSSERAAIRAPVRVCSAVAQWQSGRLLTDWS